MAKVETTVYFSNTNPINNAIKGQNTPIAVIANVNEKRSSKNFHERIPLTFLDNTTPKQTPIPIIDIITREYTVKNVVNIANILSFIKEPLPI